jgi:type II secretory pathway component PulF
MAMRWRDVETLTREIISMERAGLPLPDGLRYAAKQLRRKSNRAAMEQAASEVEAGEAVSDALARQKMMPDVVVSLVRAGEQTGELTPALERLASYTQARRRVAFAFRAAATYPAMVLTFALIVSSVVTFGIVPDFIGRLDDMRMLLPESSVLYPASMKIAFTAQRVVVGVFVVLWILAVSVAAWSMFAPSSRGLHLLLLRLPVYNRLFRYYLLYHFASVMSLLLGAGASLRETLQILAGLRESPLLRDAALAASEAVENGLPVSHGLRGVSWFPRNELWLMEHAESDENFAGYAGDLSQRMLDAITRMENILHNIEPNAIVLLALVVAAYVVAVAYPLIRVFGIVKIDG